ncbi:T9SS type A sorting domain-containing protein [bacterium]|nr:T9SS type A sorting domain-containing protein [bacterium]
MRRTFFSLLWCYTIWSQSVIAQSEIKVYDKQEVIQARASWFLSRRTVNAEFPTSHYMQIRKAVADFEKTRLSKDHAALNPAWSSLGPSAIVNTGYHNYTGRIISVNVSPFDTNIVIIGTAGGGIWKSTDGGFNWSPRSDDLGSLAVSCFARHPSDPDVIYAGTGEPSFVGSAIDGIGVIKSTDGGDSWSVTGTLGIILTHIAGIVVNQNNPNIIVVANYYNSADPATNGIYRSTNAGATWQTTNATGTEFRPSSLVGHPSNNDTLYALMGRTVVPNQNGFWKSTNAGASWFPLANGSVQGLPDLRNQGGKSVMSICRNQPNFMYAIFSNSINGDDELTGSDSGLFKSTNGGLTWTNANLPDQSSGGLSFFNGQGMYDIYVAVHPSNPNIVYAGGIDMYRTTNGGGNWSNMTDGYVITRKFHPDQQAFAFNPLNPNTIYLAGDGGIMKSYNGGQSLIDLNNGLQITQFIGLAVDAQDTNHVLAGSQDNGTELFTGNMQWDFVADGDGGYTEIDPVNSNIQYSQRFHVAPESFSQIKTTNGWQSLSGINAGLTASDRSEFYVPYTLDENVPTRLYLGTYRVYRTVNSGISWTAVSGDLTDGNHTITAIRVAQNNSNYVCAGTFDGRISLSTNAGTTWTTLSSNAPPQRPVSDIVFRMTDENTFYAAFQGFALLGQADNKGHIWKTNNAGISWNNISGNLPDIPVNALALNPSDTLDIVAGTDVGIFRTTDGGVSWAPFNTGFPSGAFVMRLVVHKKTGLLFASTHGRGVFKTKLFQPALIATINPSKPNESQAITLHAFIPELSSTATLYYGTNDFLTTDSTSMSFDGIKFTGQIPAAYVTEKGVWYRVKIENAATSYYPSEAGRAHIAVNITPSTIAAVRNNSVFAQGLIPDTWNTFSLPFETTVSLTKIFGAQKSNKDGVPTNWAAYSYNTTPISELVIGSNKGYVIQHTSASAIKITPDSGATNDINFFNSLFLKPGWNFLPWPFAFSAPINILDQTKIGTLWTLYENSWSHSAEFRPFAGYAVYNKTGADIRANSVINWNSVAAKPTTSSFPMIQFNCKTDYAEDNYNFIGMDAQSADGIDMQDEFEPPQFGKGVSLYFQNEMNGMIRLSSDIRPETITGHVWNMRVENLTGEAWIMLSWEQKNMPVSFKSVLVDITHNVFVDLTGSSDGYSFKNEKENVFKIIMGSAGYVESKTSEIQAKLPGKFALSQNYPNPFNPNTMIPFDLAKSSFIKLRIYNILGQEVRLLKNEFLQTGSYAVPWDGKDQRGTAVSSGLYIYRLETKGFIQSRKMLFIK